ncbi:A disintegrin and metalloproteinase with thrombospondin motifs 18-like [Saccostrea cucullata]|uniref:A disintegrin and metalloproteinase with thrombospondin motifs 18-like n=1 Tax=Saccostrea cuccullata TaxID=36930 RepID=UPI002ECFB17B
MVAIFTLSAFFVLSNIVRSHGERENYTSKGITESSEVVLDLTLTKDGARIEFNALKEDIILILTKASPTDFMAKNLPVVLVDGDEIQSININFQEHGIEFYKEVNDRGYFSTQCLSSRDTSCTLEGSLFMEDYEILIEPLPEDSEHLGSFNKRKHRIQQRKQKGLKNFQHHLSDLQKKFIFGLQDHVTPIPGSVNATVEVLVWTDLSYISSFHQLVHHPHVETDILKYVATVVHAGNEMFRNGIKDPSLNISVFLTGAVICKSADCSKFTSSLVQNGTVENHKALDLFAETLATTYGNHTLMFHYDYAVAFTRYDLVDVSGTPIGVSFTDDICSIKNGKSSSIIEDQGGFTCIGTFVHEMAHTLGSDHDGWFRGQECDPNNGYIMDAVSPLTTNAFYFSQCTINSIKTNLLRPEASCVLDKPRVNHHYEALTKDAPGQIYNVSEQCHQIYGTSFCLSVGTTLEDICHKMYCWDPILSNVCSTKSAAAPGTSCGHKKWCVDGVCVHDDRAP